MIRIVRAVCVQGGRDVPVNGGTAKKRCDSEASQKLLTELDNDDAFSVNSG